MTTSTLELVDSAGEAIEAERLVDLLRPDERLDTVLTADVYGAGAADQLLALALFP